MKIIKNKWIPFKGFACMNILGLLFVRTTTELPNKVIRHETIHTCQQYEILAVSALISLVLSNIYASWWYLLGVVAMPLALYVLAWLLEIILPPYNSAYKDSPFEREAYHNEHHVNYFLHRPLFAWVKFIMKPKDR